MNKDIYFELDYAKINEPIENGVAIEFRIDNDNGLITHTFIKRKIPFKIEDKQYYDIITPYGYGGPIIHKAINKKELLNDFYLEFSKYCDDNDIVSEFIRFHPIFNNQFDFSSIYDIQFLRKTIGTNLKDYAEPVNSEFSKSTRKLIRKNLKENNFEYYIEKDVTNLDDFKEIYYSTMRRNDADDFYYFDTKYFDSLLEKYSQNIITVNVILNNRKIAMGLYFVSNKIIHVHLSGTLSEYLEYSPAYILKYATTIWGKEHEYDLIHYGGGSSNNIDDSLYKFKKKFGKNTEFDFYIGKKIWDQKVYYKLCEELCVDKSSTFFPAYRKKDKDKL